MAEIEAILVRNFVDYNLPVKRKKPLVVRIQLLDGQSEGIGSGCKMFTARDLAISWHKIGLKEHKSFALFQAPDKNQKQVQSVLQSFEFCFRNQHPRLGCSWRYCGII